MIAVADVETLIRAAFPDAEVLVLDKTGMSDHFMIHVKSAAFAAMGIMDRHRAVMNALQPAYADGRLHAAEIQTSVK